VIVVALAAGGIAAGLELAEPRLEDMPQRVTPPSEIELSRDGRSNAPPAAPSAAAVDLDSGSCLDHPAEMPFTPPGSGGCAALIYNADGTCTQETATIENFRPVRVKRTVVRCP
jgi:hypothetical protein